MGKKKKERKWLGGKPPSQIKRHVESNINSWGLGIFSQFSGTIWAIWTLCHWKKTAIFVKIEVIKVAGNTLRHTSLFVWMKRGRAYLKQGKRGNPGSQRTLGPLHFDWQCHICKRVMNHKTRVKGKLTQQLTGDWNIELEVFNLAAELTWSLYNKLQCQQGNISPDGSPFAFLSSLLLLLCPRESW